MSLAALAIRRARHSAGLTQTELAVRLRTTQSAVARLERPGSNPTIATLSDAIEATGHRLDVRSLRRRATIDEAQLRARLALSPNERLQAFMASQRSLLRLRSQAAPSA